MSQKPSTPKGTRDFSVENIEKRKYITSIIERHFKQFCYEPLETPSFENLPTLMGSYGEEGDRLIFKILNSGDYLKKANETFLSEKNSQKLIPQISEKALRYDLTVPFSRYVAMHQNKLTFPFKRYQIQPVWRADRPQKGRFREFYQCDVDVVGSKSLWQEIECLQIYDAVFSDLKLPITIKVNNRKILAGIAEVVGIENQLIDFTVAMDKLDKIGKEGVIKELTSKGISEETIKTINPIIDFKGDSSKKLELLKTLLKSSEIGKKGVEELEFISSKIKSLCSKNSEVIIDITLARGLHYYTGCIFEVSVKDIELGSVGGGGRYDNLTSIFGLKNMSGIGISFGLDRIYIALEELDLFPKTIAEKHQILFVNFGNQESIMVSKLMRDLRKKGFNTELYPDSAKMKKQLNYANKKNISYVVILGEEELKNKQVVVRDMKNGSQTICDFHSIDTQFEF